MALTTKDIANFIGDTVGLEHQPPALYALHVLLIKSLSPSQKKAYDLILAEDSVTSYTCNAHFGWASNHAGNVLKSLHDLGLADRQWEEGTRHVMVYRPSKWCLGQDKVE